MTCCFALQRLLTDRPKILVTIRYTSQTHLGSRHPSTKPNDGLIKNAHRIWVSAVLTLIEGILERREVLKTREAFVLELDLYHKN
jgi:hypothetical protein